MRGAGMRRLGDGVRREERVTARAYDAHTAPRHRRGIRGRSPAGLWTGRLTSLSYAKGKEFGAELWPTARLGLHAWLRVEQRCAQGRGHGSHARSREALRPVRRRATAAGSGDASGTALRELV